MPRPAPPEAGELAPDFVLRDQHGQRVSLSACLAVGPVVLIFFPFAFSGVCTGELRTVQRTLPRFRAHEVAVLAVSCDPMFALRAFADRESLAFPLLSDFWPHGAVAASYGVLDEGRGCARRSTFVLDGQGRVRWSVHNALPEPRDVDDYLGVLGDVERGPGERG